MTTLVSDTFTGTNGSALNTSNWVVARATTGASATIVSNRARLNAGTLVDYDGAISIRANIADVADAEWLTSSFWYQDAQDGRLEAWLRCDDIANPGNGYFLTLTRYGSVAIYKAVGFSFSSIATASFSFTTGVGYKLRFRAVGSTIQAKVWAATDAEPSSWTMSVTDSSITAAGECALHVQGGGTAGLPVDLDDVTLTDGATGLTRVTSSAAMSWDVRQRPPGSAPISFDVRQRAAGSLGMTWDVQSSSLTRVTAAKAMSWDVQQRVASARQISWDVVTDDNIYRAFFVKHGGSLVQIAGLLYPDSGLYLRI